jgi:hypothetical protein
MKSAIYSLFQTLKRLGLCSKNIIFVIFQPPQPHLVS